MMKSLSLAVATAALLTAAPAFAQDNSSDSMSNDSMGAMSDDSMGAMSDDSMGAMSDDSMGAMSDDSMGAMSGDHMGSMMMMEGGQVIAIMPDGHMGTTMMDTDKMNSTVGMAAPIEECVMFIVGPDGNTYKVDTSSDMAQDECTGIAL